MSEMVERMAKAMFDKMAARTFTGSLHPEIPHMVWEDESEALRDDWRQTARDGIAAMREPTEAMNAAAEEEGTVVGCCNITADPAREIWQIMIDAATHD